MIKRGLLTSMFLALAWWGWSQEVQPGEQAKGLAEFKNVSVDYCTGRFNYQIPLFELNSGDYKLPVSLAYTANGVKTTDQPGLLGYGWNLICGGVVTRVLRGGIADEEYHFGCAAEPFTVVNDSLRKAVNRHDRDGESDLFTAVFNGQRVRFILEQNPDGRTARAVPLEKTGVKIDAVPLGSIPGWRITDENGVVYLFEEAEETREVALEEGVSANSVAGTRYISSWYLTKIIPPHAREITFRYSSHYTDPDYALETPVETSYRLDLEMAYQYGTPMQEYTFNLEPYREELEISYQLAGEYANSAQLEAQIRDTRALFSELEWKRSSSIACGLLPSNTAEIAFYDKCMGLVTDLESLTGASAGAISALESYIGALQGVTSHNGQMLRAELQNIQYIYKTVLTTTEPVTYKKSGSAKRYVIGTKRLTGVTCGTNEVALAYDDDDSRHGLRDLILYSSSLDTVLFVSLTRNGLGELTGVSLRGGGGAGQRSQTFTYHGAGNYSDGADAWGYHNGTSGGGISFHGARYGFIEIPNVSVIAMQEALGEEFRDGSCHEEHLKRHSLHTITTSTGASVSVDYERNWLQYGSENADYGGLRLKEVVIHDGIGHADTTRYHYEDEAGASTGRLVVTGSRNGYTLTYNAVDDPDVTVFVASDFLVTDGIQDDGMAFLVAHNNGVMYRYVREERVGQGSTGHYFHVPGNTSAGNALPSECAYWQYGLPIGRVDYDAAGRIVSLQRNRYHASSSPSLWSDTPSGYVDASAPPFAFSASKLQLKSYGFYMDAAELKADYLGRPEITLYNAGGEQAFINPYQHVYLPNLAPRSNILVPDLKYHLYLGGKVVLKSAEQLVPDYDPAATAARTPAYADLFDTPAAGSYCSTLTTYHYGPNHVYPVRVSVMRGDGEQLDSYTRRVADIVTSPATFPVLHAMKDSNAVAPVVVEQSYLTRDGSGYLLGERVTTYTGDTVNGRMAFLPSRARELQQPFPSAAASLPGTGSVSTLYSADTSDYGWTLQTFSRVAGALLGAASETPAGNRVVVRDAGSGEIVLQATNLPREGVAALDRYRLLELSFEQRNLIEQGFTLPVIADFDSASTFLCHFLAESDTLASSPVAQQDGFLNDETYLALLRFCRGLLMQSPWNSLAPSISLLRTASPSLHDRCSAFLERAGGDIPGVDGAEFLTMVQFIEEYLNLLDASNYRYLDHPGNAAGAGLQSGRTLSVAVSEPTTYLFHAVNRSLDDGTVTVNGKVTRSDGSTTAFSRTFPVTGEAWLVRTVSIDLTGFENAASIVKLEVSVPVTGGVYRALPYGTALAVLVPAGAEFEAVSRDRFGRVFCTLDHSGNFERHERDGLGRVTAVHDHHGNTLQEKTYHEAEKTSNE